MRKRKKSVRRTSIGSSEAIDVVDEVGAEIDQLKAVAELMLSAQDEISPEVLHGTASILLEMGKRVLAIVERLLPVRREGRLS